MRLHVFEYMTKRLDEVLSFVEHIHGHVMLATKMRPTPSVELEMSPPPVPIRPADLQKIGGEGIREGIREALILALLKAIRLGPVPSDQNPQVQEEEEAAD